MAKLSKTTLQWREIPGYDGRYLINRDGQVKSVVSDRYYNGRGHSNIKRGLLKTRSVNGHLVVSLCYNGHSHRRRISALLKKVFSETLE